MTKTSTVSDFMPDTQVQELRPGVTIEAPGAADQEATTRLLNEVLRSDAKVDIEADLPLLVGPDATSYRRIVRTEGKIVAHAALYVHSYRLLNHAFNVGVIGAVATAESERSKGYGSALINELLGLVSQYNIPVCILWSQTEGFYEQLGFVSGGRETIHVATAEAMPLPSSDIKVRAATRADLPALRIIHNQEASLTVRSSQEWECWMNLPETSYYVLENRAGIISYAVVGKGHDLQNCVHEWGGPDHQLAPLVGAILSLRGEDELFVMSSPWKRAATTIMSALGAQETIGVLGMIRITDPHAFTTSLGAHHIDDATIADHTALVGALFGKADGKADGMDTPLPFYLFGLDSM